MSMITTNGKIITLEDLKIPAKCRRLLLRFGSPLQINGVNFKLNYIKADRISFQLVDKDVEIKELEGADLSYVQKTGE